MCILGKGKRNAKFQSLAFYNRKGYTVPDKAL